MHTRNRTLTTAILVTLTLVVGAVALPAVAQPDERPDRPDREDREERREQARERAEAAREKYREHCAEPENETIAERCEKARDVRDAGQQARRHAKALVEAIDALEHRIAKLEVMELRVNMALEDGNLTGNETAALEQRLERIDAAQQKAAERLMHLYEKLDMLKKRWDKVDDYVVVLCHQGDEGEHTIRVAKPAARAHMAHGDTMGPCEAGDDVGDEDEEASGESGESEAASDDASSEDEESDDSSA